MTTIQQAIQKFDHMQEVAIDVVHLLTFFEHALEAGAVSEDPETAEGQAAKAQTLKEWREIAAGLTDARAALFRALLSARCACELHKDDDEAARRHAAEIILPARFTGISIDRALEIGQAEVAQ